MAHEETRSTAGLFVGPKRVFDRAGFETVLERKRGRPLMRKQLKGGTKKDEVKRAGAKPDGARPDGAKQDGIKQDVTKQASSDRPSSRPQRKAAKPTSRGARAR